MLSINKLTSAVSGFMQEGPITHESLKKDMESYLVSESTILEKVKKYVTSENINIGIGKDANSLQTLLTASLANKRPAVAQFLIDKGADLNMGTEQGGFPLVLAAKNGDFGLVSDMVSRGASPANLQSLVTAAIASGIDAKTLTFLLQKGAGFSPSDIFAVLNNHDLLTVMLKHISGKGMLKDFSKGLMIEKGCDLIPMMLEKKWFNVIRLLCDAGFELNHKDHIALIQSGKVDLVQYLLDKRVFDANSGRDGVAQTPLITAVQLAATDKHIGYQMTELLLDNGANINAKNRAGIVQVQVPNSEKKQEVIVGRTPLLEAVHQGNKNIVELLCTRQAHKEIREIPTEKGLTPLQVAVKNGNLDLIYTLVIWGADINVLTNTKENLLHGVTNLQIVQYLVGKKVDIFQPNGNTPREYPIVQMLMHEARTKGRMEVYDDVLIPVFHQQIANINSFLVTLNANQKSQGTLVSAIVSNKVIDIFAQFQEQKEKMRQMSLILAAMQKSPYSTHLATKSKEFQELVAEMEQTFVNLVTNPGFSAFISEMTSGRRQFSQCHEALKFIAGALTPVMANYEKKTDAISKAMLAVEAQVNQALMMMGNNKNVFAPHAEVKSGLTNLAANHEQRNAGIAMMTDPDFVEKFTRAVETKSEEELKALTVRMKPYENFFQGQGDETTVAIHKMYVEVQAALGAIEYQRTGFLGSLFGTSVTPDLVHEIAQQPVATAAVSEPVVSNSVQEEQKPKHGPNVNGLVDPQHRQALAKEAIEYQRTDFLGSMFGKSATPDLVHEIAQQPVATAAVSKPVVSNSVQEEQKPEHEPNVNGLIDFKHKQALAKFKEQLEKKQDLRSLEMNMKTYLRQMTGLVELNPAQKKEIENLLIESQAARESKSTTVPVMEEADVHKELSGWVDEAIALNEAHDLERYINTIQTAIENPKNGALVGKLQALKERAQTALSKMNKQE